MRILLDEVLDKVSIIKLKFERIEHLGDKKRWANELIDYSTAIGEFIGDKTCTEKQVKEWLQKLYKMNGEIWDLESDIRKGKDDELGLDEIGRRAIKIREKNKVRISIKAEIVETIGKGYVDVKENHVSAKSNP